MGTREWIVEVLGDVAAHAKKNEMEKTYSSVIDAMRIAAEEILVEQNSAESKELGGKMPPKIKNYPHH